MVDVFNVCIVILAMIAFLVGRLNLTFDSIVKYFL